MQRFGILNFVGWVIEIFGWLVLVLGIIFALVTFAGVMGTASRDVDHPRAAVGVAMLAGPMVILVALGPIWAGLLTVAAGQVLRVQVVIARSTQETVLQLNQVRRALGGGAPAKRGEEA